MNLPNKLTIFRIILVPIMVAIPFFNIQGAFLEIPISYWIMNLIFIIASYTDHLDGKIARKNNLVTTFGKFADPLADKILVLAAMLILVEAGNLPAWIPIIVLFREFVVSGYRLIAVEKGGEVIAANIWGKIKTVTQMIAIILMFININNTNVFGAFINGNLKGMPLVINILATVTMTISVIATIFSGWSYIKNGKDLLKD
ncbi:MAG: CDP-diacylglycerol--glycerol-3-phosphate 3-phosphatidyltransferase [Clostridia bacterium]|nr:CDP-diacylglycerol--glycerol-3-phosphate 3-phosphatidyltransferase [Clostridia bacterium]